MNQATKRASVKSLQRHGVRPSPQRIAVLSYLYDHKTHPTAENVYKALTGDYPTLSQTTVYQTLEALYKCGLALKITIEDDKMRFDADTSSHGHFKCTGCGEIYDILYKTIEFPPAPEGFTTKEAHLYYRGICAKCNASVKKMD